MKNSLLLVLTPITKLFFLLSNDITKAYCSARGPSTLPQKSSQSKKRNALVCREVGQHTIAYERRTEVKDERSRESRSNSIPRNDHIFAELPKPKYLTTAKTSIRLLSIQPKRHKEMKVRRVLSIYPCSHRLVEHTREKNK